MSWPSSSAFSEAIQNPKFCFRDSILQTGKPAVNSSGLPVPISGNFATVYKITIGKQRWAVRCFTREVHDLQQRYHLLSKGLSNLTPRPDYLVGFEYQHDGIRIAGKWYPIVKMEWIDGVTLRKDIEQNLNTPSYLIKVANDWKNLVDSINRLNIAHGDLSAVNVMVDKSGRLRLVDYDGMFMPNLIGNPSLEIGNPNFQHPKRTKSDWGAHMDHFSAFVIYTSLIALSYKRDLWQDLQNDALVFTSSDFENPGDSARIQTLAQSSDLRLQDLAHKLDRSCRGETCNVQSFSEMIAPPVRWYEGTTVTPPKQSMPPIPYNEWSKGMEIPKSHRTATKPTMGWYKKPNGKP